MKSVEASLRELEAADIPLVYNSWLHSYRSSPSVRNIPNNVYYTEHHAAIEKILASGRLISFVACDPADPKVVYGYVVAEDYGADLVVHWVYCKQQYRRAGLSKALLAKVREEAPDAVNVFYTHYTKACDQLRGSAKYNPYYAWR